VLLDLYIKEYNVMHLFRAVALIGGHHHAQFSTVYFGRIYPSNTALFTPVIQNTRVLVQAYFKLQVYISHRDSSIICAIFSSLYEQAMAKNMLEVNE
jgi:hypothetical protein